MNPIISILLVTYQSEVDILACLDSINRHCSQTYEVLVVDTGSKDKTIKLIQRHSLYKSKRLKLFTSKKNLGYAGGQQALSLKARGKYLFFLNPDAIFTRSTTQPLFEALESNEKVCCAQPAVYLTNAPETLNLTGKFTHYLGFDYLRSYMKKVSPPAGEISSISGSGVLCRASTFRELGGFDTSYFMYYEDSDLSWRARLAGYIHWFEPASILLHDYKFEPNLLQQSMKMKLYYNERNRLITVLKNYSFRALVLISPIFIFTEILMFGYSILNGWFDKKCQAVWSVWQLKADITRSRSHIQATRRVSDHYIVESFVSTIEFAHFNHPVVKYFLNPILKLYWMVIKSFI